MSRLYIEEMGLEVKKIKKWFKDLGFEIGAINDEITAEYIDGIITFQKKFGLGDDGIFGYRTYDKICQIIKMEQ